MSHGSPCMVEIYNQDNWVLFMLDSHGAEPCDRRFGSAVRNAIKMMGINSSNEWFAICRKEVLLLQNLDVSFPWNYNCRKQGNIADTVIARGAGGEW